MEPIEVTSGLEREFEIRNYAGIPDAVLQSDPRVQSLQRELARWVDNMRSAQQRGSMFDRGAFTPPAHVYDEMRAARTAVEHDDIVSGVAEITESFAFQGMKWESTESDEADVFNQWSAEVNMDDFLRKAWREEYTLSQFYCAMQWGWREYQVRGRTNPEEESDDPAENEDLIHPMELQEQPVDRFTGQRPDKPKKKGRKKYRLYVPTRLSVLDATKIIPVGHSPINPEMLAWYASKAEMGTWQDIQDGRVVDLEMQNFFIGQYKPDREEHERLAKMGIDGSRLLLMNPQRVWRHTLTRSDYEAYPVLRMKSLFGLLDMKRQLMNADRAALIGAANYILLVRKGTDQRPGTQEEIDYLKENYNFIAKLPVIISDHRLEIDIIAPKIDLTLNAEKYDLLDTRILMRLLGTLSLGARGQRNETNLTLSHAVARMMENRRHMLRRAIEHDLAKAIVEHPLNKKTGGVQQITEEPNLVFLPRHVQLGFDAALLQAFMSLRTQREISRETILEEFGLDQATEAMRMEFEEEVYDDIFKTQIPFAAPGAGGPGNQNLGDPTANGAQGGRPQGGGQSSKDATKVRPKTGTGATKKGSA
jgi:hypothetical protein